MAGYYILIGLIKLIDLYSLIIFVYVLLSWFPHDKGFLANLYAFFGKICDPYLDLFRKIIPPIGGTVDITPIFAILVLQVINRIIVFIF